MVFILQHDILRAFWLYWSTEKYLSYISWNLIGREKQVSFFISPFIEPVLSTANDDQGLGCRDKLLINSASRGRMLFSSSSLNLCYLTCHSYLHLEPRKVNHHSKLQWISDKCDFFFFFLKKKKCKRKRFNNTSELTCVWYSLFTYSNRYLMFNFT